MRPPTARRARPHNHPLERRLRAYARPQVLAIDEIGYLSSDAHAADLLFQVISRRYEQRSIVVTTNLPFSSGRRGWIGSGVKCQGRAKAA